jgi:hypothetical protein
MKRLHRWLWLSVTCSFASCVFIVPAMGRETTVIGTATMGYDFRERSYDAEEIVLEDGEPVPLRTEEDEGDVQDAFISPEVEVISRGLQDTLRFRYAPKLRYDFIGDSTELDHALNLSAERSLSRIWSVTLANDFLLSNDPRRTAAVFDAEGPPDEPTPEAPVIGDELSRDLSGRQYWTNTASARTTYTPAESSIFTGGYEFTVLRNDSGDEGYDEYDRHTFFADFSHGFNRNWRSTLGLNYAHGLYDEDQEVISVVTDPDDPESPILSVAPESGDLQEYGVRLGIDYIQSVRNFFPLVYTFDATQYEDNRPNIQTHEWSAGWDHAFDPRTRLGIGGGPSYAKIQGLDGDWGYNGYINYSKRYERLSFSFLAEKLFETRNFTGTDDTGVYDTYNVRATMDYRFSEALSLDLFGRYAWRSNLEPRREEFLAAIIEEGLEEVEATGDITYDTNIYEIGTGMSYTFARWYTAGLRYTWYVSDGDLPSDQYTDHMVLVTLSASTELWRW